MKKWEGLSKYRKKAKGMLEKAERRYEIVGSRSEGRDGWGNI